MKKYLYCKYKKYEIDDFTALCGCFSSEGGFGYNCTHEESEDGNCLARTCPIASKVNVKNSIHEYVKPYESKEKVCMKTMNQFHQKKN